MKATVATILAVGAIATIAGCGDDAPITTVSTESSATTETASDTDFISEADSRCAEANAAIANLSSETEVSSTSATQELEITQGLLDDLQALDPPDDPTLDQFFGALEDEIAALEEQEAAIAGGDTATAESLETEVDQARSNAAAAGSEYGFETCGQEGTTIPGDETTGTTTPAPTGTPATPAPVAPTTTTPVTPVEPAPAPVPEPAPVTPPPATGGTGTGGTGSTGSGSTGGVGPG